MCRDNGPVAPGDDSYEDPAARERGGSKAVFNAFAIEHVKNRRSPGTAADQSTVTADPRPATAGLCFARENVPFLWHLAS